MLPEADTGRLTVRELDSILRETVKLLGLRPDRILGKEQQIQAQALSHANQAQDISIQTEQENRGSRQDVQDSSDLLNRDIRACKACSRSSHCTQPLLGLGSGIAKVLFLSFAPDQQSDSAGLSFEGEASGYLEKWLHAIELEKGRDAYLDYLLHCHSSGTEEIDHQVQSCMPFLLRRIQLSQVKAVVALGRQTDKQIQPYQKQLPRVFSTRTPEEVLAQPELRREVWEVLKDLKSYLRSL
jgi:uracil-DNA glycosylase family 4